MDLAFHHVGQRGVHQALGREPRLSLETLRHHTDAEVPSAAGGTRVPDVMLAFVNHLDVRGVEGLAELRIDTRDATL